MRLLRSAWQFGGDCRRNAKHALAMFEIADLQFVGPGSHTQTRRAGYSWGILGFEMDKTCDMRSRCRSVVRWSVGEPPSAGARTAAPPRADARSKRTWSNSGDQTANFEQLRDRKLIGRSIIAHLRIARLQTCHHHRPLQARPPPPPANRLARPSPRPARPHHRRHQPAASSKRRGSPTSRFPSMITMAAPLLPSLRPLPPPRRRPRYGRRTTRWSRLWSRRRPPTSPSFATSFTHGTRCSPARASKLRGLVVLKDQRSSLSLVCTG